MLVPVNHDIAACVPARRGAQLTQNERVVVNVKQRNSPQWWDGIVPTGVAFVPHADLRPWVLVTGNGDHFAH